jgi:hypothetical protein
MTRPVERKVYAGSLGALSGSIVSDFALWGVDELWWPGAPEIPTPVAAFVSALVITGFTFVAGWLAKHDPGYTEIDGESDVEPMPDV